MLKHLHGIIKKLDSANEFQTSLNLNSQIQSKLQLGTVLSVQTFDSIHLKDLHQYVFLRGFYFTVPVPSFQLNEEMTTATSLEQSLYCNPSMKSLPKQYFCSPSKQRDQIFCIVQ